MIGSFRSKQKKSGLHPADQHLSEKIVVGDHTQKPSAAHANEQFHPPQEIAANEEQKPETSTDGNISPGEPKHRRSFKQWLKSLSKKQWIIIGIVTVLLLGGGGVGAYYLFHHNKPVKTAQKVTVKPTPKPTTVASNLTGVQVDPSINQKPVTGIMIENSGDARPQSGLNEAGVVFEAIAEGGITRFLALFQDNTTSYVGPVRSVRPYYIQWALGFDAAIAHVGGSAEGLQDMIDWNVKNLDQFANGSYFHRISTRYAPHNVYTSIAEMNELESKKGYGAAKYTSLQRKKEDPAKVPAINSIDLDISSAFYNVHYDYDAAANAYKRSVGGAPATVIDQAGASTQLEPKVVVALVMNQGISADDLHTAYAATGSGPVRIFQDGRIYEGTWKKDNNTAQFTFTDSNNKAIGLDPGQTWFTVVRDVQYVTYR
ncbi:MAG TPA: DUF3048 domain-containing protein [Patescibacteria group bacterium]|nr:DUF3048 domain-containing protein [Patescibacteria group bacterium]